MNDTEKLDDLIRMVQELRDEMKALREELERNETNRERDWRQVAPLTGTWTEPEDTGTPYRMEWVVHHPRRGAPCPTYRIEQLGRHITIGTVDHDCEDETPTHAEGWSRAGG